MLGMNGLLQAGVVTDSGPAQRRVSTTTGISREVFCWYPL